MLSNNDNQKLLINGGFYIVTYFDLINLLQINVLPKELIYLTYLRNNPTVSVDIIGSCLMKLEDLYTTINCSMQELTM
jgi:hypothetical protein